MTALPRCGREAFPPAQLLPSTQQQAIIGQQQPMPLLAEQSPSAPPPMPDAPPDQDMKDVSRDNNVNEPDKPKEKAIPSILPSASKKEKFLLMAADQETGSRDERLNRVIQAKYEAGLLKPYDYVKGYARLSRWMDRK